jgi:hypothetical protein
MACATFTDAEQGQRVARGMREVFEFTKMPNGSWICETEAGRCYEVTETGCTCPDHRYRCAEAGTICKHRCALNAKLLAEQPKQPQVAPLPHQQRQSAAAWLVELDLTAVDQHLKEAAVEDAEPELPATTYRVMAAAGNRERVVASGLSRKEAEDKRWALRTDRAFMFSGLSYWIEEETDRLDVDEEVWRA